MYLFCPSQFPFNTFSHFLGLLVLGIRFWWKIQNRLVLSFQNLYMKAHFPCSVQEKTGLLADHSLSLEQGLQASSRPFQICLLPSKFEAFKFILKARLSINNGQVWPSKFGAECSKVRGRMLETECSKVRSRMLESLEQNAWKWGAECSKVRNRMLEAECSKVREQNARKWGAECLKVRSRMLEKEEQNARNRMLESEEQNARKECSKVRSRMLKKNARKWGAECSKVKGPFKDGRFSSLRRVKQSFFNDKSFGRVKHWGLEQVVLQESVESFVRTSQLCLDSLSIYSINRSSKRLQLVRAVWTVKAFLKWSTWPLHLLSSKKAWASTTS